jgi:hypothetical protein
MTLEESLKLAWTAYSCFMAKPDSQFLRLCARHALEGALIQAEREGAPKWRIASLRIAREDTLSYWMLDAQA